MLRGVFWVCSGCVLRALWYDMNDIGVLVYNRRVGGEG